jgi:hypothetical protein
MHAELTSSNGTAPKQDLIKELQIIGEVLANLTYLTSMEADHSDEVRLYMKMADQQLDRMFKRLHVSVIRRLPS